MSIEWIAVAVLLAPMGFVFYCIAAFNRLATLRHRCQQAFADVDVQLRHRHDLIPGLVEIARSYATHERGIIESVVQARSEALKALAGDQRIEAETVLGANIVKLMSVVESLPEMRTSGHFSDLRSELVDVNHKIAAARRFWNLAVREYNASLEQFPASLFGASFGHTEQRSYDLGVERVFVEEAPAVKL